MRNQKLDFSFCVIVRNWTKHDLLELVSLLFRFIYSIIGLANNDNESTEK